MTSYVIIIGFLIAGKWILISLFQIEMQDLMAAGGLLLLIIAIDHLVFGALVKDTESGQLQPLWPGKWTVAALKADFKEYKDMGLIETWMCEMMNMPGHGENGFTLDQLNYLPMPTPDQVECAWLTLDPAFGQQAHNDESAIALHVIPRGGGTPMTVLCEHGHWTEAETLDRMLRLAEYWNAWVWGIEAIAAQRVLISLFNVLLATRMMLGMVEMIPLMSGRGDPKAGRIRAFVSLMANGEWALSDGDIDITNQIVDYDFRKKEQADDIIDSCAYGPLMMEDYLGLIQAMSMGQELNNDSEAQQGAEVTSV
jgi:hypothetical protein